MSDFNPSSFLNTLFQKAKTVGKNRADTVTAERLLIAAIDMIILYSGQINSDECVQTGDIIRKAIPDPKSARAALVEYVDNSSAFIDQMYFQKCKNAALKVSKDSTEVTAVNLFASIFNEPSEAIKKVMSSTESAPSSNDSMLDSFEAALARFRSNADASVAGTNKPDEEKSQPEETASDVDFPEEDAFDFMPDKDDGTSESDGKSDDAEPYEPVDKKAEMAALVDEVKLIREKLRNTVFGQDNAVNVFVTGYFQARMLSMIDSSRKRPSATFLFAGPPGVGKTFLAESAAEALGLPFMRFDMSEYADKEASIEFCGSDKVYKNAKAGNVTSFVAAHRKCVLLFDEIEKAHLTVIHLFLQMLDAGRLRDNYTDNEVSFKDTILIFTTNAGKQLYEDSDSGDFSSIPRKVIIKALQKDINPVTEAPYFPGAICSRFASGNVVMFNHIGADNLRVIAKREIKRHAARLESEMGIKMNIDERVYTALLFSEGANADARTIRGRAEAFFNDELYELLRLVASDKVGADIPALSNISISLDLAQSKPEIVSLFEQTDLHKVLVFMSDDKASELKAKLPNFHVISADNCETAVDIIKSKDISFILLDMSCGAAAQKVSLNIEDIDSDARNFFKFLKDNKSELPVYLLEYQDTVLSDEEQVSFMRQGVRGVLKVNDADFTDKVTDIASAIHQQAGMIKLARENKTVSFETSQSISENGANAQIMLFDFEMTVAVDSEDSKNVLSAVSRPNIKLDDVIGAADAKKELTYFIEYLKNPKKYLGTGVKAPKGVLLYGPPGTGKTMLAKAVASESDVTFIVADGNQFLKKYVGEGPEKVHELFKTARKYAPSILFIDEIDAIAKERRGSSSASGGVEETLTAFLTEMDGFASDPTKPVFVLAATNFDVESGGDRSLDAALMRRFDRRVYIELPGKDDRVKFLNAKFASNSAFDISPEQVDNIAMRSTGMSLASLDSALELALRSAIREGSVKVTDAILEEAFETFNSGESKKWDASQLERVARHESGHAFMCWHGGETPTYLTIVARGNHGGYMQHADNEGKAIYTKEELLNRIRTALGGRAAEIVYYGDKDGISTGASGDLVSATAVAQQIVCTYGMDDGFGLAVVNGSVAEHGSMAVEIRNRVNAILNEQMAETIRIISENKDRIDSLVGELMAQNHLTGAQIEDVLGK